MIHLIIYCSYKRKSILDFHLKTKFGCSIGGSLAGATPSGDGEIPLLLMLLYSLNWEAPATSVVVSSVNPHHRWVRPATGASPALKWKDGKVIEGRGAIQGDGTTEYDQFWSPI
jgi:hypothetical protein